MGHCPSQLDPRSDDDHDEDGDQDEGDVIILMKII